MDTILVVVLAVLGLAAVLTAITFFTSSSFGSSGVRGNIRNLVATQRQNEGFSSPERAKRQSIFESAQESRVQKTTTSALTIQKRLKYAQWPITPLIFRFAQVGVSLFMFGLVSLKLNIVMQLFSLLSGPLFMGWLLNLCMDKRFKAFDSDYPQFLLSLVGLLKTGMNIMGAIEAATQSLEEGSLLRHEVLLMSERLRLGVSEDKSIGSFGEDIFHPEIELFVQALLLSRRVGGNLSETLDRLAKQVRKRQFFRASASAAVGMQRGSIWIIIAILVALEVYLYFIYPAAVTGAWASEMGWQVWQGGVIVIILGIWWVRQVTKIRV